jgi:hypothetical protein
VRVAPVACSDLILPVKPFWFFGNMGNRAGKCNEHFPA